MKIHFHKNFDKQFKKLHKNIQKKAQQRIFLFLEKPYAPVLRNHFLKGKYLGYRSIDITGDYRALFKEVSKDECIFVIIDTHSNLYQ